MIGSCDSRGMTTTPSFEDLRHQIEHAIQGYIAASRAAAQEAVEQAFIGAAVPRKAAKPTPSTKVYRRRKPEDIEALGDQLYRAVCAQPGEPMVAFATTMDLPVRELHLPMSHLKTMGRVRSVGQRHLTRYFPVVQS